MGCFLGCFRIKDDGSRRCQLFSKPYSWKKRELLVDKNQYTSVISSEENSTPSEKAKREISEESSDRDDGLYENLRQEAKFLKTCGAILETPIEIRKASIPQSLACDPFCKNINQQLDSIDCCPTKAPETLNFEEVKHKDCESEETDDTRKMVRFEELNHSVCAKKIICSSELEISPEAEYQMQPSGSESPYPTPLNLIDGLQTPGTIYPPKFDNFRNGRIQSQFVFPVPNLSQISLKDRENTQNVLPASLKQDASGWLKPQSPRNVTINNIDFRKEQFPSDNSPDFDRPIIGVAAAHWSGEDPSRISPKQWDGNGIPNSTTKYKEDQKVSWHATPFEVRLEKALSDEKVYPQRNLNGTLIVLEDESRG